MGQTITLKTTLKSNIDPQKFEEALENYKNSSMMIGALDDNMSTCLNLKDVACKYNELNVENGDLIGEVDVLDTPNGKIVQTALDANFKFDFNPRMIQDENGNYDIMSIDLSIKI
jgi:hypothetical protein